MSSTAVAGKKETVNASAAAVVVRSAERLGRPATQ
jgi:hypothetical protein